MDYIGTNCPVCEKPFEQGEDVVVCPECGTPHHRECYEKSGHCVNTDKHKDGFEYQVSNKAVEGETDQYNTTENEHFNGEAESQQTQSNAQGGNYCPRCGNPHPADAFYCSKCGFPVGGQQNNGQPFNNPQGMGFDPFDPMGGVHPDTDMGDGITAGEMSKYVQKNTSYFSRVFNRIKTFGKGKFNFSAFLFSGGYLLYRKMYKIGSVITAVILALMVVEACICLTPAYQDLANSLNDIMTNSNSATYGAIIDAWNGFNLQQKLMMVFMNLSAYIQLALQIVTGIFANKWYFKHCKKKISAIKNSTVQDVPVNNTPSDLETKGGVNMPIAISLFVVYLIISYLPNILMGLV